MSAPDSSDSHFFNSFGVVLGILVAFAILLFAFARVLGRDYQNAEQLEDPLIKKAAEQNTMPFGREAIAGQDNSALATAAASPEPGTITMFASGLLLAGIGTLRRRARS